MPIDIRNNILVRDETVKPDCDLTVRNGFSIIGSQVPLGFCGLSSVTVRSENFDKFEIRKIPPSRWWRWWNSGGSLNEFMSGHYDGCWCFSKILETERNVNFPIVAASSPNRINDILTINNRINVSLFGPHRSFGIEAGGFRRFFCSDNRSFQIPGLLASSFNKSGGGMEQTSGIESENACEGCQEPFGRMLRKGAVPLAFLISFFISLWSCRASARLGSIAVSIFGFGWLAAIVWWGLL